MGIRPPDTRDDDKQEDRGKAYAGADASWQAEPDPETEIFERFLAAEAEGSTFLAPEVDAPEVDANGRLVRKYALA